MMKNEIIDTEEGLAYISASGIKYDILEGKHTDGDITSDILFVFLNNPDYNCTDHFVGYVYGADQLKHNKEQWKYFRDILNELTKGFEYKNNIGNYGMMNSNELSKKIIDCLSDGYDDEENREEEESILFDEVSQLNGDSIIRVVLRRLCERIDELEM